MEAFVILLFLGILIGIVVLPIAILVKVSGIARDVEDLKGIVEKSAGTAKPDGKVENRPMPKPQQANRRVIPNTPLSRKRPVPVEVLVERADSGASTALDVFWERMGDWFCVSGTFAPKGMTREFAVATRWLVRIGILMLVAGIVYFVKLSIDRGWMGPTGRVVATLFWGVAAAVAGTWLVKHTRYGVVGHGIAAIGIVALYLGFGLGHRLFDPPVIQSAGFAFTSLAVVTVCVGIMAVFLNSPTIAVMGLVGGYLVPVIAKKNAADPLGVDIYLLMLNMGAFAVSWCRRWSALDFLAAMQAFLLCFIWSGAHLHAHTSALLVNVVFLSVVHALYLTSVLVGSKRTGRAGGPIAWSGLAVNAGAFLVWLGEYFRLGFSNEATGFVFLALAGVHVAVAIYSVRHGLAERNAVAILIGFGLLSVVIAQVLLFGAVWCTAAWTILSLGGVLFGLVRRIEVARLASLALLGISVVKLLVLDTVQLAMPARVAASTLTGALLIVGAFLYIRFKERFETNQGKELT